MSIAARLQTPACVLVLVLATLACFLPLVLHPADLVTGPQRGGLNDVTESILPVRQWMSRSIADRGEWPMWNPFGLSGCPWLGNPQSAAFYPPNWLYILCRQPWMVSWVLVLHHLWGGVGTFVLGRRYGLSHAAATLAGISFLGAPYLIANTGEGHYNPVCLIAWMPWAFLCYEKLRAGTPSASFLLSAVLALAFFCGHVQELVYISFILTAFVARDCWRPDPSRTSVFDRHLAVRFLAAGCLAGGLVAIDLLPAWAYTRNSVRSSGVRSMDVGSMIDVSSLWQLLNPQALGGPADYAGPGVCYWETVCSFGVIVLLLALLAVLAGRRQYPVPRMFVVAIACLIFALGTNGPIFAWMHAWVPGVGLFRAPSRALFHASFAIAILAGAGLDVILAALRDPQRTRLFKGAALVAGVLCLVGLMISIGHRGAISTEGTALPEHFASTYHIGIRGVLTESPWQRTIGQPLLWVWLLAGTASVMVMTMRPRLAARTAWLLVAATGIELAVAAQPVLRTIGPDDLRESSPLVELLRKELGESRVAARHAVLTDREAWAHGIRKIQGYEPVALTRYLVVVDALSRHRDAALEAGGFEEISLADYEPAVADLLGIKLAVVESVKPPNQLNGWNLRAKGRIVRPAKLRGERSRLIPIAIYENPDVLPRAFVTGNVRLLEAGKHPAGQIAALSPREEVLLERDVLPAGPRATFRPARIVSDTPNELAIEAVLDAPGYLVVCDTYAAGWKASIDDRPLPVLPAFVGLRAVPLSAGSHRVQLRFTPPLLGLGAFISGVSLITVIGGLLIGVAGTAGVPAASHSVREQREPQLAADRV